MKRTKAWRRHQKNRVAKARRRWVAEGRNLSNNELQDRHPFDCGRRCFLCHGEKLLDKGARRARDKRNAERIAIHADG